MAILKSMPMMVLIQRTTNYHLIDVPAGYESKGKTPTDSYVHMTAGNAIWNPSTELYNRDHLRLFSFDDVDDDINVHDRQGSR